MNRLQLIALILIVIFTLASNAQTKPNIVVVMADDIGVGDIGFYHKQRTGKKPLVATPNIDKLIEKGMRFADAHSPSSLCAPTRFSMLTGNFSYRNYSAWGVWSPNNKAGIDPEFTTAAHIAKKGGYTTAFFGKWGLGGLWTQAYKDYSNYAKTDCAGGGKQFGFDYSLILPQGIQNKPYVFYENGEFMKLEKNSELVHIPFEQTKYGEDNRDRGRDGVGDSNWDPKLAGPVLANKAVEYIKMQSKNDTPFYMYYCSQAVHVPHTPSAKLNGEKIAGTTPGNHGDMIKELDIQVAMIINALKKSGAYKNTLFVFTSDNGGLNHDKTLRDAGHNSSNGLMGKKGSIYEGGHRVPFIAVWPGNIKPGSESDVTVVGQDIVATIASIAGVPIDKSKIFDSANLLPVLKKESNKPLHKYLMHASQAAEGPFYALREGDWKLIMKAKDRTSLEDLQVVGLYNLAENLNEKQSGNLMDIQEYTGKINEMKLKYLELRNDGASTVVTK